MLDFFLAESPLSQDDIFGVFLFWLYLTFLQFKSHKAQEGFFSYMMVEGSSWLGWTAILLFGGE